MRWPSSHLAVINHMGSPSQYHHQMALYSIEDLVSFLKFLISAYLAHPLKIMDLLYLQVNSSEITSNMGVRCGRQYWNDSKSNRRVFHKVVLAALGSLQARLKQTGLNIPSLSWRTGAFPHLMMCSITY